MFKYSKLAYYVFLALAVQALVSCSGKEEIDFFPQEVLDEMYAPFRSSSSIEQSSSSSEQGSSSSVEQSSSSGEQGSSSSAEQSSSSGEQGSSSSVELSTCGTETYNPETQFCYNNNSVHSKCNGEEYIPSRQHCNINVIEERCGSSWFDPNTHFCKGGNETTELCGGTSPYGNTQFCSDNIVYDKCGTSGEYDVKQYGCCVGQIYSLSTHLCHGNKAHSCGEVPYNPETQFCFSGSKAGNKCGKRTEIFDPDKYECREGSKIYLKDSVYYGDEYYNAVLIGEQTWMARNLNYNYYNDTDDRQPVCYENENENCAQYGKLYSWIAAMDLGSECFSSSPCDYIKNKHNKGVCPSGWHIPKDTEWDNLIQFIYTDNTSSTGAPYFGYAADKYLKATSGWRPHSSGSEYFGLDTYGFFALPGGNGYINSFDGDYFNTVFDGSSYRGDWWSASNYDGGDDNKNAYYRNMGSSSWGVYSGSADKHNLYSVRCVMD
jgi:uncharacterized protein (TIGR02145 family)